MSEFTCHNNEFPAGEYYIGDFCYLLDDKDYDEIVCSFMYDGEPYTYKKFLFMFGDTAYGDGVYCDNKGLECYLVDSGTLGIINLPTKKIQNKAKSLAKRALANVVVFDKPFTVGYNNGIFFFGGIVINTGEDDECLFVNNVFY